MTPTPTHPLSDRSSDTETAELVGLYDDPEQPTEYTVYPADADDETLKSQWLSVDAESTVDLEEMR